MLFIFLKVNLVVGLGNTISMLIMHIMKDLGLYTSPKCEKLSVSKFKACLLLTCLMFLPLLNLCFLGVMLLLFFDKETIEKIMKNN